MLLREQGQLCAVQGSKHSLTLGPDPHYRYLPGTHEAAEATAIGSQQPSADVLTVTHLSLSPKANPAQGELPQQQTQLWCATATPAGAVLMAAHAWGCSRDGQRASRAVSLAAEC